MNKDKILKPYEQNEDSNYVRFSINNMYYAVVYKHMSCNVWYSSEHWTNDSSGAIPFSSLDEAMSASDQALIDEGFIILTQEQLDKFTILF